MKVKLSLHVLMKLWSYTQDVRGLFNIIISYGIVSISCFGLHGKRPWYNLATRLCQCCNLCGHVGEENLALARYQTSATWSFTLLIELTFFTFLSVIQEVSYLFIWMKQYFHTMYLTFFLLHKEELFCFAMLLDNLVSTYWTRAPK